MKTIHKYKIEIGLNQIQMPRGSDILSFGTQHNQFFIWAIVNTQLPIVTEQFYAAETGEHFPGNEPMGDFIGTAQRETIMVGPATSYYVLHLFAL